MMTAQALMTILTSPEYRLELEEMSSYAASIKQERPMVVLLAKYLRRQSRRFRLEDNHCDIVVDGIRIEFKFHYDFDITDKLHKELKKHNENMEEIWKAAQAGTISESWTVIPGIYKDVCGKKCDVFVWVVCARDVSRLTDDQLIGVCMGSRQRTYNERNPYEKNSQLLEVVDTFLEKLQRCRKFSVAATTMTTKGDFPSSYHLRICEFARAI